jgi:cholesterol transport system auxiliary component
MIRSLALLSMLLLANCSILPEQVPVDLFQLPAPTVQASGNGPRLASLRIERPLSSEALGGSRLLIMTADNQFQALPNIRFAAAVPALWRDWLLDAFWRDGRVTGLSSASEGLQAELELGGTLRAFHVDYTGSQAEAFIQYDATLIDTSERTIIASRRFEARHALSTVDAAAAVAALGVAANELARELLEWTLREAE